MENIFCKLCNQTYQIDFNESLIWRCSFYDHIVIHGHKKNYSGTITYNNIKVFFGSEKSYSSYIIYFNSSFLLKEEFNYLKYQEFIEYLNSKIDKMSDNLIFI